MWRTIALLVLLAGTAASPARATQSEGQPYRIDSGNRLITQVMIDGQGPFSFVIDTASSKSMIYGRVRAQLGLTRSQPDDITVFSLNSTTQALPVKPSVLMVAGQAVHGLTLGVLPPAGTEVAGVDGILGIDVLDRYFVVLDRSTMRLLLLAPGSKEAERYHDWANVTLTPRPLKNIPINFWYMSAQVGHRTAASNLVNFGDRSVTERFTALLDLGAGFTMMNWPAAERLGAHEKNFRLSKELQNFVRDALGTDEPAINFQQLTITLGSRRWTNQAILVANSDVFTLFNLDGKPAMILGAGLLRDNSLAIDFAGHRLFIGPAISPPSEG